MNNSVPLMRPAIPGLRIWGLELVAHGGVDEVVAEEPRLHANLKSVGKRGTRLSGPPCQSSEGGQHGEATTLVVQSCMSRSFLGRYSSLLAHREVVAHSWADRGQGGGAARESRERDEDFPATYSCRVSDRK